MQSWDRQLPAEAQLCPFSTQTKWITSKISGFNKIRNTIFTITFMIWHSRYGKDNEKFALADLGDILSDSGLAVENCGLYVDTNKCFLAASPDGVIGTEAVVEVKCPLKCVDTRLDWLAKHDQTFCLQPDLVTGGLRLKRNHDYFYQVQGQMHITKRWMLTVETASYSLGHS